MITKIDNLHSHVDNGGITVEVEYDFDNGHTIISFSTDYYGYPDIVTTLRTWGTTNVGDSCFLRELGLMFLRASERIKPVIEEAFKVSNGES